MHGGMQATTIEYEVTEATEVEPLSVYGQEIQRKLSEGKVEVSVSVLMVALSYAACTSVLTRTVRFGIGGVCSGEGSGWS